MTQIIKTKNRTLRGKKKIKKNISGNKNASKLQIMLGELQSIEARRSRQNLKIDQANKSIKDLISVLDELNTTNIC